MLIILAWVTAIALPYFYIMRRLGLLRVPLIHEVIGLDIAEMGSKAKIDSLIVKYLYGVHMRAIKDQRSHNFMRSEDSNRMPIVDAADKSLQS